MPAKICNTHTAAAIIHDGGVIAYPTEAVYGLGCDPHNHNTLQRLMKIKQRSSDKGLILIAANVEQLSPFMVSASADAQKLMDKHWPGPVTLVVKAKPNIDPLLTGSRDTLAVRVSDHPGIRTLCHACGHALVSTSANISGQQALKTEDDVLLQLGNDIDAVLRGDLGNLARPTMIIDVESNTVLRS